MAKRPTAKPTDPPDPATEAKAQRMISNVRSHYDRGRRANSSDSELSTVEFAAANGVNVYTMRKDRRFARLYSEDQVTVLLALRRPNGLPLHWGHVEYLLQIEGADERRKFGERAARQGWSAQQLRVAIQGKFGGKGSGHGSRIKPPANAEAGLLQLIEASEGMRARCRVVMEKLAQAGERVGPAGEAGRGDRRGTAAARDGRPEGPQGAGGTRRAAGDQEEDSEEDSRKGEGGKPKERQEMMDWRPGCPSLLVTRAVPFDSPWRWRKGITKGITGGKKPTKGSRPKWPQALFWQHFTSSRGEWI